MTKAQVVLRLEEYAENSEDLIPGFEPHSQASQRAFWRGRAEAFGIAAALVAELDEPEVTGDYA